MRLTQTLSDAVDEQKYVGVVFFDLKKAFDRVWHKVSWLRSDLQEQPVVPTSGRQAICLNDTK